MERKGHRSMRALGVLVALGVATAAVLISPAGAQGELTSKKVKKIVKRLAYTKSQADQRFINVQEGADLSQVTYRQTGPFTVTGPAGIEFGFSPCAQGEAAVGGGPISVGGDFDDSRVSTSSPSDAGGTKAAPDGWAVLMSRPGVGSSTFHVVAVCAPVNTTSGP